MPDVKGDKGMMANRSRSQCWHIPCLSEAFPLHFDFLSSGVNDVPTTIDSARTVNMIVLEFANLRTKLSN